jgi:hypothetical protein
MNEIKLGDVTITRIEEMHGPIGMTPDQFFPGSPERAPGCGRAAPVSPMPEAAADKVLFVTLRGNKCAHE